MREINCEIWEIFFKSRSQENCPTNISQEGNHKRINWFHADSLLFLGNSAENRGDKFYIS